MCLRFRSGSRGFTRAHLGVTWKILVPFGSLGQALRSPDSFRFDWAHGARLGVAGIIQDPLGSFGRAKWSSG